MDEQTSDERDRARSRRARSVRPRTTNVARMSRRQLTVLSAEDLPLDVDRPRPKTRADCARVARPCPWVGCNHSLFLEVSRTNGSIKLRFPDLEPHEIPPDRSCALDVAERGGATLQEVGDALNMVRERVRQIQKSGCAKLARDTELGQPGLPDGALRELLEGHIEDEPPVREPRDTALAVSVTPVRVRPLFATPPERRTPVADEDEPSDEVGTDETEEQIGPMAPVDLSESVLAVLKERGPLPLRALALAAEIGPHPLRDLVRRLRDEGTVHMVGKGASARWTLVGEARPAALEAPPLELAPPSTRLAAGKSNGTHPPAVGANGAAHPKGAPTRDRVTTRLLAAYERARRALEERRRVLADELQAIDRQLEGPSGHTEIEPRADAAHTRSPALRCGAKEAVQPVA